jgi:hypothetical protein
LANQIAPWTSPENIASKAWLRDLPGGLPVDFDYRNVRSATDAKAMMFELPGCDRTKAAVQLYYHRKLVGRRAAYLGIMLAWNHDSRRLLEAFGSTAEFIRALKNVAPPVQGRGTKPIHLWRGVLLNRTTPIVDSIGTSWTRSRNAACWFALHEYVPELQPSLAPLVLHACFNRSAVVAQHNARAEQEVIIDLIRQPLADSMIMIEGANASGADLRMSVADLYADEKIFDRLVVGWRQASSDYEQWKKILRTTSHFG